MTVLRQHSLMSVAYAEVSANLVWRECQKFLPRLRRLPAIRKPGRREYCILGFTAIMQTTLIQPRANNTRTATTTYDLEELVGRLFLLNARQLQGQRAFDKLGLPLNRVRITARPHVLGMEK